MSSYTILGVSTNCTEEDVKKAFRRLSLKHHPDVGGNKENFIKIQNAKDSVLKDIKNRANSYYVSDDTLKKAREQFRKQMEEELMRIEINVILERVKLFQFLLLLFPSMFALHSLLCLHIISFFITAVLCYGVYNLINFKMKAIVKHFYIKKHGLNNRNIPYI